MFSLHDFYLTRSFRQCPLRILRNSCTSAVGRFDLTLLLEHFNDVRCERYRSVILGETFVASLIYGAYDSGLEYCWYITPLSSEQFHNMHMGYAKTSLHFRRRMAGTPSGPASEFALNSFIPFVMWMSVSFGGCGANSTKKSVGLSTVVVVFGALFTLS